MNRLSRITAALFLSLTTTNAQTILSNSKPTEKVVIQYETLVANGSFLTAEGWRLAGKLYEQTAVFPSHGEISLMSTGGSLGETSINGDRAEVETKWTDYFGTVDSALRYRPPKWPMPGTPPTMTAFQFRLVYTNKHLEIGKNGEVLREVIGSLGMEDSAASNVAMDHCRSGYRLCHDDARQDGRSNH